MGNFQKNKLRIRILAAIPAAAILIACIILHGWYIFVAAVVLAVELEIEMIHSLKRAGYHTCRPVLIGITLAMPLVYRFVGEFYVLALLVFGAATLFAVMIVRHDKYTAMDSMVNIFALIYPMAFVFFLFPIILEEDVALSQLMLVCAFAAAFGTDIFAYFSGILFGKRKLCPNISPNKTVEGAVGGLIGCIAITVLVGLLMGRHYMSWLHYLFLGIALGVLSQFGDLSASMLKRQFQVKDFGNIMPGHGGLLDRVDSVLFTLPVVCVYFFLYFQLI